MSCLSSGMVDPLVLAVVVVGTGVGPLQESLATQERGCEKSNGTLTSFQSFKRISTRNTQTPVVDHL